MTTLEQQAQELIKQHLSKDAPSYQVLNSYEHPFYGFMEYYLFHSKNDETMSTTADYGVTMKLARIDQPRDYKEI